MANRWETISDGVGCRLERIQVPGGWLYRTVAFGLGEDCPPAVALAYVPGPASVTVTGWAAPPIGDLAQQFSG